MTIDCKIIQVLICVVIVSNINIVQQFNALYRETYLCLLCKRQLQVASKTYRRLLRELLGKISSFRIFVFYSHVLRQICRRQVNIKTSKVHEYTENRYSTISALDIRLA